MVKGRPKNKGEKMGGFPEPNSIKGSLCFVFFLLKYEQNEIISVSLINSQINSFNCYSVLN